MNDFLQKLRKDLEDYIGDGLPEDWREDFKEWADAYYFGREEVFEILMMILAERKLQNK